MKKIRFYSVLRGPGYLPYAKLMLHSLVKHNPGIQFTLFVLGTVETGGVIPPGVEIRRISEELVEDIGAGERFKSFWFRYFQAPDMLEEDHLVQIDLDMVCVSALPLGELSPSHVCGCSDPSGSVLLHGLDSCGWWVPPGRRSVYLNAGLLSWSKSLHGHVFAEAARQIREDSSTGEVLRAPFDDQAYINAAVNTLLDPGKGIKVLPSKWNVGVWTDDMFQNTGKLLECRKVLFFHVFSAAGHSRMMYLEELSCKDGVELDALYGISRK